MIVYKRILSLNPLGKLETATQVNAPGYSGTGF